MDTSIADAVTDILRTIPGEAKHRQVVLQRLTEMCAAGEAASALRAAARDGRQGPLAVELLAAASAVWDAGAIHAGGAARGLPTAEAERARVAGVADRTGDIAGARERLATLLAGAGVTPLVRQWISELRDVAVSRPSTGACTLGTAFALWLWTSTHVPRPASQRDTIADELAEAFCWLAAARCQIADAARDGRADSPIESRAFFSDLCHVQAARSAGAVATICAELVFGYRRHPAWDFEGCAGCYQADDLDELEGLIPGIASEARIHGDVIEADGSHAAKAGPCARLDGLETFTRLRTRLDACLTGARLTKDRAAEALPRIFATATAIR